MFALMVIGGLLVGGWCFSALNKRSQAKEKLTLLRQRTSRPGKL